MPHATDLADSAVDGALEALLLLLEVLEQLGRPVAHDANVQREAVGLLGRRADGEGVPLEGRDSGDVDEDVVSRLEGKVLRPFDDQRNDARGQHDARGHPRLA